MGDARPGILPSQWIRQAIDDGIIESATPIADDQIQPNSLDLRIGERGHRVRCSFLPGREGVAKKLDRYRWYDLNLSKHDDDGSFLERNQVYLFPLDESLKLPKGISGRANPKSSTGRLDVFTRVVVEDGTSFDEVPDGYHGKLYLEVVPRSFAIRVRPGDSFAQIRFQRGNAQLADAEVAELLKTEPMVLSRGREAIPVDTLTISSGVWLSVQLTKSAEAEDDIIGFQARKNTQPIDLRDRGLDPNEYWDVIRSGTGPVILEPDEFYIFASQELVRLPPEYCAEMVPFDAGSGELRTHYAGFFDSGFGFNRDGQSEGAAVVLEIRNRDVPFLVDNSNVLFRLLVLRNTEPPEILYGADRPSNYQGQKLKLAKQFGAPRG
ncbi:2'-deoxycytidine 5'-triphosphate deaminase [bacterium]|nr:2'-deoxycytidine 5'-triphosphate deaminase [bacterium]